LDGKALEKLWADLSGDDAPKAYAAGWKLVAAPEKAITFMKDRLAPAVTPEPKRVRQLIADLDSDKFAVREQASKELEKLGEIVEPALRQALKGQPSPELRRRVETLLALPATVRSPEVLRRIRAIQVLERIGSADARHMLENVAKGAPAARESQDALAALQRLKTRSSAH
jgi:hypothetical protein